MRGDWEQVSGDVTASVYGATFGQLDASGSKVWGVSIVEVINMVDACGRDWDVKRQGGEYVTESSYVDVDSLASENWQRARSILDSCGMRALVELQRNGIFPAMPYSAAKRVVYSRQRARDLRKLADWERRTLKDSEKTELDELSREVETLREWYSIPRMARAEMAVSYGGYGDGQSLTFHTLREAMDYHGIPSSALWRPSEYDAMPESEADETDETEQD